MGTKSCSQKYDISVDRMMESDVAKPFRMLSAYLMTAAMTRPPSAWRNNKHTDTDGQRHDLEGPPGSLFPQELSLFPQRHDALFQRWWKTVSVTCRATTAQVSVLYP